MSPPEAGSRPLRTTRRFALPINPFSSTRLLPAIRMQRHRQRLSRGRTYMTGLTELFGGLMIIGSITGLVVGVAVFLGRKERKKERKKERRTQETGKV